MWKLFVGDIPIRLAEVIAFLGYYVCPLNVIFIFIALSVIRVIVYQKCAWFTSLDKMNVVKAVLVIAMFIVVAIRIAETFVKYKKPSYVDYIFYISSVSLKNNPKSEYPSAILIFHLTLTLVSFLLELYISVRLKKLPFFSLKSATLGHVFMAAGVGIIVMGDMYENSLFSSIELLLLILLLQILYCFKYKSFIDELVRKSCCTRVNPHNIPEQQDIELNDIGIFVGSKMGAINTPFEPVPALENANNNSNRVTSNTIEGGSDNIDINDFGGVYIGSPVSSIGQDNYI